MRGQGIGLKSLRLGLNQFLVLLFLLSGFGHDANASFLCEIYLRTFDRSRIGVEDSVLLLEKLSLGKNEIDFWQKLAPEVKATEVRFHTSRSPNKASAEHPRSIYIDEKDPIQTVVYAFSARPEAPPILEIQTFRKDKPETAYYEVEWNEQGRPAVKKNPRRCFGCHSGGRPIHTSIPTRDQWPFIHPDDISNSRNMERLLSELNRDFQFRLIENKELPRWWVELLDSAFNDPPEVFQQKLSKAQRKHKKESLEEFYLTQREIFFRSVQYNMELYGSKLLQSERLTLRLVEVFELGELAGFLDLLSLNVRPNNFELNVEALKSLQEWSEQLSIKTPARRTGWFDFLNWF